MGDFPPSEVFPHSQWARPDGSEKRNGAPITLGMSGKAYGGTVHGRRLEVRSKRGEASRVVIHRDVLQSKVAQGGDWGGVIVDLDTLIDLPDSGLRLRLLTAGPAQLALEIGIICYFTPPARSASNE